MIALYDDTGARLPQDYNGLTLNDPDDDADDTFEVNSVTFASQVIAATENRPAEDGSEIYTARKSLLVLRIDGTIRAPSLAKLYDKRRLLAAAFDPAKASHDSSTDLGFLALDFDVPTTDTGTWATGFVPSRYYARARQTPMPPVGPTGTACFFAIELLIADPRRYHQTQSTLSGDGTATNLGDYRTYPTITITMAGAGSSGYRISNDPAQSGITSPDDLTLDLSGLSNGNVVTVDMFSKLIQVNGADAPELYVAGDYFPLEAGANAIGYTNTTNATSSLGWRHAWTY